MKSTLMFIGSIGGSGILAAGSWFVYDFSNPTLAKRYKNDWKPIEIKLNKFDSGVSSSPYKGSSCFQRFFGGTEIKEFKTSNTTTRLQSSESVKFESLFDTKSDIYGCAVGDEDFYELVLKNDQVGLVTWYDGSQNYQKIFKLTKSGDSWQIELGILTYETTTGTLPSNNFTNAAKIQSRTGKWYWWFYMSKNSNNLQKWSDVFKLGTPKAIYKNNEWNQNHTFSIENGEGQIPKFDKVEDLTNFCKTQGAMRKEQVTEEDKVKKLNLYCLLSKSSTTQTQVPK